jgi:hypothetical protein
VVDDPEARTHDGLNAHTRGAPMLVDGSGDLGRGRLKRGMGGLDACALGGTSKAGGSGTRGSFSEGNRRGAETSLYGISPDDDVASFDMGEPSGGATLGSWVTVLGDGSDEICDSVAMTAGNYIRGMGESVPSVGTSDGGGGLPAGGNNRAQGADDVIVGLDGGCLGEHGGRPSGKHTGGFPCTLCNSVVLDTAA